MTRALPGDYDTDPDRFRSGQNSVKRYGLLGDVQEPVAERFAAQGLAPTLDLGCGEGRLSIAVCASHPILSMDLSMTMLRKAPVPKAQADGMYLPFVDGRFGSVAALWCLYHFEKPRDILREVWRVLREGGLFATSASARDNDPELAHIVPSKPSTFDAEEAEEIVAEVFGEVEAERWDVPAVRLPDEEGVRLYLRGRGLSQKEAAAAAKVVETPLELTKRGCLVYAYRS